jgi:hypothetical protein
MKMMAWMNGVFQGLIRTNAYLILCIDLHKYLSLYRFADRFLDGG